MHLVEVVRVDVTMPKRSGTRCGRRADRFTRTRTSCSNTSVLLDIFEPEPRVEVKDAFACLLLWGQSVTPPLGIVLELPRQPCSSDHEAPWRLQVLSGSDVGFRIVGTDVNGKPIGDFVVRLNGNWVEPSRSGLRPLASY